MSLPGASRRGFCCRVSGSRAQCFCDATFTRDTAGLCQACGPHLVCEGVQTLTVEGETVLQADAVQGQRGGR